MALTGNPSRSPLGAYLRSPLGVMLRNEKPRTLKMAFVSQPSYSIPFFEPVNSLNSYFESVYTPIYMNERYIADAARWSAKISEYGIPEVYFLVSMKIQMYDIFPTVYNTSDPPDYIYVYEENTIGVPNLYNLYELIFNDNYNWPPSAEITPGDAGFYDPSGTTSGAPPVEKVIFLIEDSPNMDRTTIATQLDYLESYLDSEEIEYEEIVFTTTEYDDPAQGRWLQWFCDIN